MADVSYRQVILRVFNALKNALHTIDLSDESLVQGPSNTVTVSTTVIRITDFFPLNGNEKKATFQVISGGPVNLNASKDVTAGGAEGSPQASIGDVVKISGYTDIEGIQMVKATGGSDAEVRGVVFRRE